MINNTLYSLVPLKNSKFINAEWLEQLLSNNYNTEVIIKKYNCNAPSTKEGFLSEISYVNVEFKVFDTIKTEHLVFKFYPQNEELVKFIKSGNLVEREVNFYKFTSSDEFKTFCNGINIIVPEIIYSDIDDTKFTIVMKDLNLLNYKTVIRNNGSSLKQIKATLLSIAIIHASGLNHHKINGEFPLKKLDDIDFVQQIFYSNFELLYDKFKDESSLISKLSKIREMGKDILSYALNNNLFETIIHGDLWAGQCMLSENEEEVCILDWQFARIGNPVVDLLAYFCMSTDLCAIENDLEELLVYYWSIFIKYIDANRIILNVNYSQFKQNLEEKWIIGFFFLAASIHDFTEGNHISTDRLKSVIHFLESRHIFSNFIAMCANR